MNPETPKPPRIVTLGTGAPEIKPDPKDERLEDLLRMANLLGPENNQNGTGSKNNSKEVRAERRRVKLARKANRDGRK